MRDCSKEASSIISAVSVNAPMRNLRLFINALTDKADIAHWRIDGQGGDDGGSFE